jgi:enoyl reductase-like protein
MKKNISLVLMCVCLFSNVVLAGNPKMASDPRMTKEERDKVVQAMLDSQKELMEMIVNLTDEQWNFRPAPFKWTVGQTAEHIALGEGLLFAQVERALAAPENPDWEAKTANKLRIIEGPMAGRQGRAQAPEPIQPIGKNMTRAEIMKLLKEGREKSLKFARETNADLKSHTTEHPFPVFGTLNAYQWLWYVPGHNFRHNKQIAEIKAHPNFPK